MKIVQKFLRILLLFTFCLACQAQTTKQSFVEFTQEIKADALKIGVSKKTVDKYLNNLHAPQKQQTTIKKKYHQEAQKILSFHEYLKNFIFKERIDRAINKYKNYNALLSNIEKRYHVAPEIIVALWGIESDFGEDIGDAPMIQSLAILAYNRQSPYFRQQLLDALVVLDQPKIIPEMEKSTFDGGMGQPQFEPSTYLSFAVDFDNDGFKNIWTNIPDALASIANFLNKNGWQGKQPWVIKIKIPKGFPVKMADGKIKKTIKDWQALGIKPLDNKPFKNLNAKTAILLPDGINGPAYLLFQNFDILLQWNNTPKESLATGILANIIAQAVYSH